MKFKSSVFFLLMALFLVALSCKKNEEKIKEEAENRLPNFGNVQLGTVFSKADSQIKNEAAVRSLIQNYYQNVWKKGDLWGGILVAKGDKILFEKYRGFTQSGNQQPVTAETPMHVASVSKTLTAMAILKLVDAGKISLDDHVTKFFPKFPYPEVTIHSLLSQRSGLPKYEHFIEQIQPKPEVLSKKFLTNKDIMNLMIQYKPALARDTDTGFMYCNTNFATLALIIEKVTRTPFPVAMQYMVFRPLKMTHSYIFQEKDTLSAAKSFYNRGPSVYPYDRLDLIYGDKNVYTTPRDLYNFSKALYSKDFLSPALKAKIFEPYSNEKMGTNNYGYGFRMKVFDNGQKLTYHNGWWHGTNSVFAHLLDSKVTIIAIGNKYSNRVYSALALSSLFQDLPFEAEKLNKVMHGGDSATGSPNTADSSADRYTE